jgi:MFS transporter, OFA family, oxalate/formate antiporter
MLLLVPSTFGIFAFVALFGAARGSATLTRPALLANLYGALQFASIAGVLGFALSLAYAFAPAATGVAYDRLGTYEPIFWVMTGVSAVAVLAILPLRSGPKQPRTQAKPLQSDA